MARAVDSLEMFYPEDRNAWRNWLQKNYQRSVGIWLIYYKVGKSKPRLPYNDIVEECLCFVLDVMFVGTKTVDAKNDTMYEVVYHACRVRGVGRDV